MYDVAVVGAGIVGLASAWTIIQRCPDRKLLVLEKESDGALHQSGHNSGVIHSGVYYKLGSFKARLSAAGNRSMAAFCREHGLPHEVCGKLIVATHERELPGLRALYERGIANGLALRVIDAEGLREVEPHAAGLAALHVQSTGITDYRVVCQKLMTLIQERGGQVRFNATVERALATGPSLTLETSAGAFQARFALNCAGLHSDRVARAWGLAPSVRIVPFRGEYYALAASKRWLVKGLIYPVTDPGFPFLGVHFTRGLDRGVHVGPSAVLSFKREGYGKHDLCWRDAIETLSYPGFWKLARRHVKAGGGEVLRSWSKTLFVRRARRLIPQLQAEDLISAPAGVRAQALHADGTLVDDFLFMTQPRAVHVLNAPSPAATCALEIASLIADRLEAQWR